MGGCTHSQRNHGRGSRPPHGIHRTSRLDSPGGIAYACDLPRQPNSKRARAGRPPAIASASQRSARVESVLTVEESEALRAFARRADLPVSAVILAALHAADVLGQETDPSVARYVIEEEGLLTDHRRDV